MESSHADRSSTMKNGKSTADSASSPSPPQPQTSQRIPRISSGRTPGSHQQIQHKSSVQASETNAIPFPPPDSHPQPSPIPSQSLQPPSHTQSPTQSPTQPLESRMESVTRQTSRASRIGAALSHVQSAEAYPPPQPHSQAHHHAHFEDDEDEQEKEDKYGAGVNEVPGDGTQAKREGGGGVPTLDIEHAACDDDPREWSAAKKNWVLSIITIALVSHPLSDPFHSSPAPAKRVWHAKRHAFVPFGPPLPLRPRAPLGVTLI